MKLERQAFTLIEMLVAIGIILILIAISTPAILNARKHSNQSVCVSNLRQCGLSLSLYHEDYGAYPDKIELAFRPVSHTDARILLCPQDPTGDHGGIVARDSAITEPTPSYKRTINFSYNYLYQNKSVSDGYLKKVYDQEGSRLGILACQLHGVKLMEVPDDPPHEIFYQGVVLRLQHDGAVVNRKISFEVRTKIGETYTLLDPIFLFSDNYVQP